MIKSDMKVLFISTADYKYGAAKTQIDMIKELMQNYDVIPVVLTKKHNEFNEWCTQEHIENYSYWYRDIMSGSAYSNPFLNIAKHMVKYLLYVRGALTQRGVLNCGINWDEIDLIHSNHIRIDIGAYISRKKGIPHVWHIKELNRGHVRIIHYKPKCYEYINKNANLFIAVTKQVKEYWTEAGLTADKIRVVYEGIEPSKFIERVNRKDNKLRLICVGRIEKSKGQLQILQAMQQLPVEIKKDVLLDLAGEAYPDYLKLLQTYIQEHGLQEQVHFLGYQKDIPQLLSGYDIGILSSKGDAFGTVVAEYMAAGVVPIATYTELVEDKKTGLRYEFGDVDKLSQNIEDLYYNRAKLQEMAICGHNVIINEFSISRNAREIYKVYEQLVGIERRHG